MSHHREHSSFNKDERESYENEYRENQLYNPPIKLNEAT